LRSEESVELLVLVLAKLGLQNNVVKLLP